jgi:hypothetical protein
MLLVETQILAVELAVKKVEAEELAIHCVVEESEECLLPQI